MLGGSHMLVGGVSYLACLPITEAIGGRTLTGTEIACGTVVAVGAALVPDADTPNSTISRTLGLVTEGMAVVLGKVFGGHRNGTHSLAFAALTTGLTAAALARTEVVGPVDLGPFGDVTVTVGAIVAVVIAFLCLSLGLGKVLGERSERVTIVAIVLLAVAIAAGHPDPTVIVSAVAIGVVSHLLADTLTPEGTVPFWPLSRRRVSVPLVGSTGDARETLIVLAVAVWGLALTWHVVDARSVDDRRSATTHEHHRRHHDDR